MNVYLPIIDETLVSSASIKESNFYLQPIPVWPTRSYTITITPENPAEDVEISILQGGINKFLKTIPYSPKIEFDLSIAGTVINPLTRDQSLVNGGGNDLGLTTITHNSKFCMVILFNADVSLHMMPALGGFNFKFPIKPRIPEQPYDIIMPSLSWEKNGLTNYDITCEPVDDYHGPHVFPSKYYLGSTIDIRYIKKLTVKSPSTGDTVAVAEYENKLPAVVENDDQMLCAARLRWNMRNGQWFWYAFKDYFWNEGFTYMRGLGGASEQGILTINVAYAKEYYPAFQELLVSSNIELTLPKQFPTIDEEQRYKMEVTSDTGARWSGSERVYRQQITLRTIGFMDNYIPPAEPDAPAIVPVAFTAQFNPRSNPHTLQLDARNNIYCNTAWYVESEPNWYVVVNGTTLLNPDMFEQGSIRYEEGKTWEECKVPESNLIRLKRTFETLGEIYSTIIGVSGYEVQYFYLDENDRMIGAGGRRPFIGRENTTVTAKKIGVQFNKTGLVNITPRELTNMKVRWGKRYHMFRVGETYMYGYLLANTGVARTGALSLRAMSGGASYSVTINQAGSPAVK